MTMTATVPEYDEDGRAVRRRQTMNNIQLNERMNK